MKEDHSYETYLDKLSEAKLPTSRSKESIWDELEQKLEPQPKKRSFSLNRHMIGIAASIAILITSGILYFTGQSGENSFNSGQAETKIIELPDGSTAHLSAQSTITISSRSDRAVLLDGEAFFNVKKGSTFTVETTNGSVEVLGTSFNVHSRSADFIVGCKTGRVRVNIPKKQFTQEVAPGEIIQLLSDTVKRIDSRPELIGNWKSGEFYFENQRFDRVVQEFRRQFHVDIEANNVADLMISCYFNNADLETALETVCLPLDLQYSAKPDGTIVIDRK